MISANESLSPTRETVFKWWSQPVSQADSSPISRANNRTLHRRRQKKAQREREYKARILALDHKFQLSDALPGYDRDLFLTSIGLIDSILNPTSKAQFNE